MMMHPPEMKIKVCGLTNLRDAQMCLKAKVDYFGFNLHVKSPRYAAPDKAAELAAIVPEGRRVLVDVAPQPAQIRQYRKLGFDFFQIHFDADLPAEYAAQWTDAAGRENLWLAPRIPPYKTFPKELLNLADVFLLDAYSKDKYGGSGQTGDWEKFAALKNKHPDKTWILAGGLSPENIAEAVRNSGAAFVDVNSGIETEPGIKSAVKLKAFLENIRR